jgi:feruloyl esterase
MRTTVGLLVALAPVAWGVGCEGVKDLKLGNVTITAAEIVAAGSFQQAGANANKGKQNPAFRNLAEFCRVAATLTPSRDSDIRIEVWMPAGNRWNANFQAVGNGAWAGSISYPAMATALNDGYATASTDTGHTGNVATFIPGHPEKVVDFAERAVHEMTVAAKAIIEANYGRRPTKSYFNGCSTGGRQALTEVQRYPADYDGVIAGAPANYTSRLQGTQVWISGLVTKNPDAAIPAVKFAVLHAAALSACDARDGVKDGVIESPLKCVFDPKVLLCRGADGADCLTAAQVDAARKTYQGPMTAKGVNLYPGLEPGSETGWATLSGARPMAYAEEVYQHLVFKDLNWNYLTFEPERDMRVGAKETGALMDAVDPNLRPYFYRGGKLLLYHGWADPGVPPRNTIHYYRSVVQTVGRSSASENLRLFLVPGMGHCGGGDGTSTFNAMAALADWAEQGHAPDQMRASRVRGGQTDRTRPLCAYPRVAKYEGKGSTDEAANFSCRLP